MSVRVIVIYVEVTLSLTGHCSAGTNSTYSYDLQMHIECVDCACSHNLQTYNGCAYVAAIKTLSSYSFSSFFFFFFFVKYFCMYFSF